MKQERTNSPHDGDTTMDEWGSILLGGMYVRNVSPRDGRGEHLSTMFHPPLVKVVLTFLDFQISKPSSAPLTAVGGKPQDRK